jgi:hypothetical protein
MQFTSVVLNKPIKYNYISHWCTIWLMEAVKRPLDGNFLVTPISSSELATAAAEPSPGWLLKYLLGWNDNDLVLGSVGSVHVLLQDTLPKEGEATFADVDLPLMGHLLEAE